MRRSLLVITIFITLCVGCSSIAKNASVLNKKVSEGIERNQVENEKIITALADVERAILNEEWDNLYDKVETKFLKKHSIADASQLTQDQRRKIAANSAKVYYDLLNEISSKEAKLKLQLRENSQIIIEINDEITRYLLSLEKLDNARSKVIEQLGEIAGIDLSEIKGLSKKLIGGF